MTNAQIIFNRAQELAKEGLIKYTGREYEAELDDGTKITIKETESIHTYATWKSLGFQVKKGEKAVAKIQIWKYTSKTVEIEDKDGNTKTEEHSKTFLKIAAFFSASQVEAIQKKTA